MAYANFADFRKIIPNASSSFGSAALLAELDTTLRQFPTVKSTVYSFNGDVAAFYEWLQLSPPSQGEPEGAVAEAKQFLLEVAGMRGVFADSFRRTGNGTGEVTCYPPGPNDIARPIMTLPTIVSLQRAGDRWTVTDTRAPVIQVDAPALALGAEPPNKRTMRGRLRTGSLIDGSLVRRAFLVLGPAEAAMSMLAFLVVLFVGGWRLGDTPDAALLATASGTAFAAIVLGQLANAYACRSEIRPVPRVGLRGNRLLLWAVAFELAVLAVFLFVPPLPNLLGGHAPSALGWVLALAAVPVVVAADAVAKAFLVRKMSMTGREERPLTSCRRMSQSG